MGPRARAGLLFTAATWTHCQYRSQSMFVVPDGPAMEGVHTGRSDELLPFANAVLCLGCVAADDSTAAAGHGGGAGKPGPVTAAGRRVGG